MPILKARDVGVLGGGAGEAAVAAPAFEPPPRIEAVESPLPPEQAASPQAHIPRRRARAIMTLVSESPAQFAGRIAAN
jgi:hypothetical protein